MNARVRSHFGTGLLVLGLAAVSGCGRTSPVSPSATAASGSQAAVAPDRSSTGPLIQRRSSGSVTGFQLLSGTFTIVSDSGDSVSGTYTGTSFVSTGNPEVASLTMKITGGGGMYAGATGDLTGTGIGVFTGEGSFALDIKGDATVGGKHLPLRIGLTGSSAVSCSAASRIAVTMSATGSMKRKGDVHATLSHEVGQSGCG